MAREDDGVFLGRMMGEKWSGCLKRCYGDDEVWLWKMVGVFEILGGFVGGWSEILEFYEVFR